MMSIINLPRLFRNLFLPLAVGVLASIATPMTKQVYMHLILPPFAPPAAVFPAVWTILYLLLGYSAYRVSETGVSYRSPTFLVYYASLLLNFIWPVVFFAFESFGLALAIIIAMIILAVVQFFLFYRADRLAGILLIPYILWLCFAAALNGAILVLN